jgi:putative DNA primase/helicase
MLFPNIRTGKERDEFLKTFTSHRNFDMYINEKKRIQVSVPYLADVMVQVMYPNYRYCTDTDVWYHFNGQQFVEDTSVADVVQSSFNQFKMIVENTMNGIKEMVDGTLLITGLQRLHSAGTLDSVMTRLKSKRMLQVTLDQFDIDDHLLNTPAGLINLKTSKPNVNSALNLCKMITNVSPLDDENGAKCPHYLNHLRFMANGDPEIFQYLEELSGYILTGDISQQKFYWWFGCKFNGKSTLARLWMHILKDYTTTGGSGQFAKRHNEPHSEEDVRLKDKRFVWVDELTGNQFNQEKIKRWSDGGYVKAAEKGGKTIEFRPKCKLLFTSNNKPAISGNDGGFERRLDLTPFMKQVDPNERDVHFEEKYLHPEAPYILNRMIQQAKRYYENPTIIRPKKTAEESAAYMQDNDIVGEFVKHCCEEDDAYIETAKNLYEACQIFCQENNYEPISAKKMGIELSQKGKKSIRDSKVRSWSGIKLNSMYESKIRVGYG